MKVLFVIPPYRTTDALVAQLYPMPYGPVILSTILKTAGHEITLKDFLLPVESTKCPRPLSFTGLGNPPYLHYGLPLQNCVQWIRDNAPAHDLVALAMGQCNIYETGIELAKTIKALNIPLLIGGPFVTTATEQALKLTNADMAIKGEAETVIVDVCEQIIAGKRGVREGLALSSMDELPLPDWSFAPPTNYPIYKNRVRGVLTISRGCPHKCSFCSVHTIMGRKHRRMTPERIKKELINLWQYGVRYFSFLDDNLFISKKATDELIAVINDLRKDISGFSNCRFYCEEGIEVGVASQTGIIKNIKEAGFENIALGIESMNDKRRKSQKKPYTQEQLTKAINECRAAGITAKAFYIIGFPGDTLNSVSNDLLEFGKIGLAARPNNLKLYPGTETTKQFISNGYVNKNYDWRLSSWFTPNSGTLTYKQIKKLKTILGAIGKAAEEWGVCLFSDKWEDIKERAKKAKYILNKREDGTISIKGNMYRNTPYKHICELLVLRSGFSGAQVKQKDDIVWAVPTNQPVNEIQKAITIALGTNKMKKTKQEWIAPKWIVGDSLNIKKLVNEKYDLIFSCPPYYNLEIYSDMPGELSALPSYKKFLANYKKIIADTVAMLKPNRFACFVVGDLRDKQGFYQNFVSDTIDAFQAAGAMLYNEAILVTAVGSLPIRVGRQFQNGRKLGKTHQNVLIFYKGDTKKIKEVYGEIEIADISNSEGI